MRRRRHQSPTLILTIIVCDNGLPESAFGDDVMGYNGALRNNLFGQFSVQPTVGCASARRPRRSFDDHRTVHAISDDPGLVLAVVIWQPESHGMRDVIVGDDVKPRTEVQCLDERGVHFSDRGAECLPRHRHTVHGGVEALISSSEDAMKSADRGKTLVDTVGYFDEVVHVCVYPC